MCSSLEGSHSRAITSTSDDNAHGTSSRPRGITRRKNSSSFNRRISSHANHGPPNCRKFSTRTAAASTFTHRGCVSSNNVACRTGPVGDCAARSSPSAACRTPSRPSSSRLPNHATTRCRGPRSVRYASTSAQYARRVPPAVRKHCRMNMAECYATNSRHQDQVLSLHGVWNLNHPTCHHQPTTCDQYRLEKISKIAIFGSSWGSWANGRVTCLLPPHLRRERYLTEVGRLAGVVDSHDVPQGNRAIDVQDHGNFRRCLGQRQQRLSQRAVIGVFAVVEFDNRLLGVLSLIGSAVQSQPDFAER